MSDKLIFTGMLAIAVVGAYLGIVGVSNVLGASFDLGDLAPSLSMNATGATGGASGFLASAASVIGGASSHEASRFMISFDNLKNIYPAKLNLQGDIRIYDVDVYTHTSPEILMVSTNRGLYYSDNTGLTWRAVKTPQGEITTESVVLRVVPVDTNSYLVSVFQNGVGFVYYTSDMFATLQRLVYFADEGVYDMVAYGNTLYLAMSNGQLIQYDRVKETFRVTHTFPSPIVRLYDNKDGFFYALLKSGVLMQAAGPLGEYTKISVQKGWFSSGSMKSVGFASSGDIYALGKEGLYRSENYGVTFDLIDNIPLLKKQIDALAVSGNVVYIISNGRMYISTNAGGSWKLQDNIPSDFGVHQFYFLGGGRVILSE
ncbi:MAG: hypothetical protein WC099_01190 [Candidatus Paceibacterota bacterium]